MSKADDILKKYGIKQVRGSESNKRSTKKQSTGNSKAESILKKYGITQVRNSETDKSVEESVMKRLKELEQKKAKIKKEESASNSVSDSLAPIRTDIMSKFVVPAVAGDDIAPIAKDQKWYEGWFQKGATEDGVTGKNVAKAVLGTGADAQQDLRTGVLKIGEAIVDAALWAAPYVAQGQYYQNGGGYNLQADSLAQASFDAGKQGNAEIIKKDIIDEEKISKAIIASPLDLAGKFMDVEQASVLGDKSDALVQSGGQLMATAALQAVGVPWWVTSGVTSFGGEAENALNQGATMEEAGLSAAITAGAEILTEKIGGIDFGTGALDDLVVKKFARGITKKVARYIAKGAVGAVSEGFEEVLSNAISELGQSLTYADSTTVRELFFDEEAADAFISGFMLGGFGEVSEIAQANMKGVDAVSGLTANEQKVVDHVYKELVVEAEKNGKISQREKSKIYDAVLHDLEKGHISTDTIEGVLGGESYEAYKKIVDSEDALKAEFNTLNKMKQSDMTGEQLDRRSELKQMLEELKTTSKRNELKLKLGEDVFGLVKGENGRGSRLLESYNEQGRRSKAFEADLTQYDEKQRAVVQKAIDSGILNNTNRTHEFVDLIAKISADKGLPFDFTNNQRLRESGFALGGVVVNGFVNENGVTININSAKALNSVVGHEIAHVLEGTDMYAPLRELITQHAKSKGEYDSRLEAITKLYEGRDANIEQELVADLVGDYLFSDPDFIRSLSTEHRNVFQKLYDEIKYLCKVATAGSDEARKLEKLKKAFVDAYRVNEKNTVPEDGVRYSLGDGTTKDASDLSRDDLQYLLESAQNGVLSNSSFVPLRRNTPEFFIGVVEEHSKGTVVIENFPMAATVEHLRQNMDEDDGQSYGSARPHGFSVDDIITMSEKMSDPSYIVLQKNGRYAEVVSFYNGRNKQVVVAIDLADSKAAKPKNYKYTQYMNGYNGGYYNIIVTQFEPDSLEKYLRDNEIVYSKKEMNGKYQVGSGRIVTVTHDTPFIENIVTEKQSGVNNKFVSGEASPVAYDDDGNAIPLSEWFDGGKTDTRNSLSSGDDIAPIRGSVYGKDIALEEVAPIAPVAERSLVTEETEAIAPIKESYEAITEAPMWVNPQDSVGAAPYGFDPVTQLQYKYGTIPDGENPVRDDSLPKSTNGKDKVSYTARTVKGAKATPDELVDLLDKETVGGRFSYIPIKNSDTVRKAYDEIVKKGWEVARGEWAAKVRRGEAGAEMTVTGALLLNNAAKVGDREAWLSVLHDYQIMGTNAGQAVQAMRILKTLRPDDSLYMIERSVDQMVEDMKLGTEIVVDKNLKQKYLDAKTDSEKDAARKALAEDVARQIPSTAADKWTALRYLNMLGNLRTQGRNILGNSGMAATSGVKNALATAIEWLAHKASGGKFHRTKSLFVNKDLLNAAKNDFANVESVALNGGKFNDPMAKSLQFQQEVQDARKIFKFVPLEKYRRSTNWSMDNGDLVFSKAAYGRALAGYLKANGITETDFSKIDQRMLDEARTYAVKEAQETTFRDNNWLSNWVSKVGRRKDTPKIGKLVSEGVMPFRKTPANILLRAEEYSPLGIVNATVKSIQAAKGAENVTGADVVNSWAKALTGTGLFALGMWLNNSGVLSGGPDEDDDKEWFEDQYGWQNYAIHIGEHNFTIDFLSPAAMPLLMGAQLNELRQSGGVELKDLETALLSIADPMIEMSMLQGVNDTLDNIRYAESNMGQFLVNACVGYLTQGLTNSFLGQLERSFDGQRMTTYVDKDSDIPAWLQKALGKASAKIPLWDYQQIPYIDAWGETEDIAPLLALMENTLSPSYISQGISDDVYEELNRLNDAQSDINVYPQTPNKTVTFDDAYGNRHENYNLTAEEYVALAKSQGQMQRKIVEDLIGSELYKELPDKYKAKSVQFAYIYARENAQIEVLNRDSFSSDWMEELQGNTADGIVKHVIQENIKGMFLAGDISADEAIQRRITYCGDSAEEAAEKVDYWKCKEDNPAAGKK